MCDEGLLSLQSNLQSVPRRELKIILQRAECIFAALKDGLVSIFVSIKIIFGNRFSNILIFFICSA
jgi:hypothetical protein